MYLGSLMEYESTAQLFSQPAQERTREYLQGHIG